MVRAEGLMGLAYPYDECGIYPKKLIVLKQSCWTDTIYHNRRRPLLYHADDVELMEIYFTRIRLQKMCQGN